jgi:2-oxoglutarate ferredoxin oxidoreductase subunit beta
MSTRRTVKHPELPQNTIGLTVADYHGSMSTLCAGCGHDSITAAVTQAVYELSLPPHRLAKISGIGCSSKIPTYFVDNAHGVNSVHGRMPAIVTGAAAANRDLIYVGVSGDGDSMSIGLGQLCHAIRRNVNMLYILANNGVYGLTKGQFSASADAGSTSKRGVVNQQSPIDPVPLALSVGASMVARSFSGDKEQLVPLIKAGLSHRGFALLDICSPCVAFNNHKGSTRSYAHARRWSQPVVQADFVPPAEEIEASYAVGSTISVPLHDGSELRLHKASEDYDPTDRLAAYAYLQKYQLKGEVLTGLLFIDHEAEDMHTMEGTTATPLNRLDPAELSPSAAALDKLQARFR